MHIYIYIYINTKNKKRKREEKRDKNTWFPGVPPIPSTITYMHNKPPNLGSRL